MPQRRRTRRDIRIIVLESAAEILETTPESGLEWPETDRELAWAEAEYGRLAEGLRRRAGRMRARSMAKR